MEGLSTFLQNAYDYAGFAILLDFLIFSFIIAILFFFYKYKMNIFINKKILAICKYNIIARKYNIDSKTYSEKVDYLRGLQNKLKNYQDEITMYQKKSNYYLLSQMYVKNVYKVMVCIFLFIIVTCGLFSVLVYFGVMTV